MLPQSVIRHVYFSLIGNDHIAQTSSVIVDSPEMYRNNEPYKKGVYDPKLGTFSNEFNCDTCFNNKRECVGHTGVINLKYPIYNPVAINEIGKWLKVICYNCGKPIISEQEWLPLPLHLRFPHALKLAKATKKSTTRIDFTKNCIHCGSLQPNITKSKSKADPNLFMIEWPGASDTSPKILYPHEVEKIFNRIDDDTLLKLGSPLESHVRDYVIRRICVSAVLTRPDVKKIGSASRASVSQQTLYLQCIIKKNAKLPPTIPKVISNEYYEITNNINNTYYDLVRSNNEGSGSISRNWRGKKGRFRGDSLGKRVHMVMRGTITEDPSLRIDEIGVPQSLARITQIEETVQQYNKMRLTTYIKNGRNTYPGATAIIKISTGETFSVDDPNLILEIGDRVQRDLIDGDIGLFNRQPSLNPSNISGMRLKIINDNSFHLNFLACPWFNADFDGDAMSLILFTSAGSRAELSCLSKAANWLVSPASSAMSIGLTEDAIPSIAELTRDGVFLNKEYAMKLFANVSIFPTFVAEQISGREIISLLLENTPINFIRPPTFYNPVFATYVNYNPKDIEVKINKGKLLQGILDKASIGKSRGSIFHIIANEYGNSEALRVMFDMQQVSINFMKQIGFTLGIQDLYLPPHIREDIARTTSDILLKSEMITERLNMGEIIPPIDKTVRQTYESVQINNLTIYDDYIQSIMTGINPNKNALFLMAAYGSKGKLEFLMNMISTIGQRLIDEERAPQKFGYKRALLYLRRYDESPEARGFVPDSYLAGVRLIAYLYDADFSRLDIIRKALSTSVTGEHNRQAVQNLNNTTINNFMWSTKEHAIFDFGYGGDMLDARKVERVKFPTVMISDAEFESKFKHPSFPDFFNAMALDRKFYRKQFFLVENMNSSEPIGPERNMAINIERIINNILTTHDDILATPSDEELVDIVALVDKYINNMPYILLNKNQERKQAPIPINIKCAMRLAQMLVRSYLHPNAIATRKMTKNIIDFIFAEIRVIYHRALIDPGASVGILAGMSFCEPLTQFMLSPQKSAAGGGSSKLGAIKTKELLSVKPIDELKASSMRIHVIDDNSQQAVQELANTIEIITLKQFVSSYQCFFEQFGEPKYFKYAGEKIQIAEFVKGNPALRPPPDLINWCVRFEINKSTLILKRMSLEKIITRLREELPNTYIVYTPENAEKIFIRVYFRSTFSKYEINTKEMQQITQNIINISVRGIRGITSAKAVRLIESKINDDGSISKCIDRWCIAANGLNLSDIFHFPGIKTSNIAFSSIQATYMKYGIEAARLRIISELRSIIDTCNYRHYITYANEMTYNGIPTAITSFGLKKRGGNLLLRTGFSNPMAVLTEAAITAGSAEISGVSAPLLIGGIPEIGSYYNKSVVNCEFIAKNKKTITDVLEELFE